MQLSLLHHFDNFLRWTINISDIVYFLSVIWICLYLSYLSLSRYQQNLKVWINVFRWIEMLIIIWIFILLNLIAWKLNIYADLTENKVHTISDATKEILWNTEEIIDINLYVSANLPPQLKIQYQQVKDLLWQFKRYSSNIVVREIHPVQDEKEQDTLQEWIQPIQIQVLENDEYAIRKWYFWISLKYLWEKEIVWYLWDTSNLEHSLISKILKLTTEEKKEVFILTTDDIEKKSLEDVVRLIWQDYQINYQSVWSWAESLWHEDDKIWLVVKWKQEFPEVVYNSLKENFDWDKTILLFWQPYSVDLTKWLYAKRISSKMDGLLKERFNLSIWTTLLWDTRYNSSLSFKQWFISYTLPYPYFIKSFIQKDLPISHWVENVSLPFSTELKWWTGGYKIKDILKTSEYAFEENDINNLSPDKKLSTSRYDLKEFTVWKVFIKDDFSLVAIPSMHILDMVQWSDLRNNIFFVSNLIDWLWWDKRLIEIRAKNLNYSIFNVDNSQKNWIKALNIYVVPIMFVLIWIWINLFIWHKRKS